MSSARYGSTAGPNPADPPKGTLEEIAQENKDIFLEHGGEKFSYIPCLNDSGEGIDVLVHLIERELQGWV